MDLPITSTVQALGSGVRKGRGRSRPAQTSPDIRMRQRFQQRKRLESIETIEADPPLQVFPDMLKQQLRDYFENLNNTRSSDKPWTTSAFHKSQSSSTATPMYFAEPDTGVRLYNAHYRYGTGTGYPYIAVVQGHQGSNFNDGQPAIVTYFGKKYYGSAGRSCKTGSRWAVWTPYAQEFRLFVNRVWIEDDISGSSQMPLFIASKVDILSNNDIDDDVIFIKQEPRNVDLRTTPSSSANDHQTELFNTSPRVKSYLLPISINSKVTFDFRSTRYDNTRLTKSLEQCNSSSKTFAYAYKAGVSDSNIMVLESYVDGFAPLKLVRDDEQDFQDLVQIIEARREMTEDDTIVNVITIPAAY